MWLHQRMLREQAMPQKICFLSSLKGHGDAGSAPNFCGKANIITTSKIQGTTCYLASPCRLGKSLNESSGITFLSTRNTIWKLGAVNMDLPTVSHDWPMWLPSVMIPETDHYRGTEMGSFTRQGLQELRVRALISSFSQSASCTKMKYYSVSMLYFLFDFTIQLWLLLFIHFIFCLVSDIHD